MANKNFVELLYNAIMKLLYCLQILNKFFVMSSNLINYQKFQYTNHIIVVAIRNLMILILCNILKIDIHKF